MQDQHMISNGFEERSLNRGCLDSLTTIQYLHLEPDSIYDNLSAAHFEV
jgi:hypothetical protein